jgi:hypothetical protein
MKDLTKGPVSTHVLQFAAFIAMTTVFQTLYFLADLISWAGSARRPSRASGWPAIWRSWCSR